MVAYMEPGHEMQADGSSADSTGADGATPAAEAAATGGGRGGGATTGPGGVETSTSIPIIERLRLYPIVLVVCWSWATVNRIKEAIEPYAQSVFWLFILQYSFQVRTFSFVCLCVRMLVLGNRDQLADHSVRLSAAFNGKRL